jgi:hypothetical protein
MCTFRTATEVMVCDVSRDRVRSALEQRLPGIVTAQTVHGEGTLFTCLDEGSQEKFKETVDATIAGA